MVKDKLPFVTAEAGVRAAFASLDSIQALRPEEQVAGVGVLFGAMCAGLGLDPSQVLDASYRRMAQDDSFHKREVKALRDYVQGELR